MLKISSFILAAVSAYKWSLGPCQDVKWDSMTSGRGHAGMNDTFFQIAEADVDIFGGPVFSWVPPCARHEFMQVEDYPVYKWVVQKQTSWIFGFFPYYHGPTMQMGFPRLLCKRLCCCPSTIQLLEKEWICIQRWRFWKSVSL